MANKNRNRGRFEEDRKKFGYNREEDYYPDSGDYDRRYGNSGYGYQTGKLNRDFDYEDARSRRRYYEDTGYDDDYGKGLGYNYGYPGYAYTYGNPMETQFRRDDDRMRRRKRMENIYGDDTGNYGNMNQGGFDRDWWNRTRDEISSWFGDEDARRRRRMDKAVGPYKGVGPKGYHRSDERIREDINDRLSDDDRLDASDIEVSVNNCEVTLTGTVEDRYAKRRAEDIAEEVSGVENVYNQIRVDRELARHRNEVNLRGSER